MSATAPSHNANRLLVVDVDPRSRAVAVEVGAALGFDVAQAASEAQFREQVGCFAPTTIIIDPQDIGATAIDLFRWLRLQAGQISIIVTSGSQSAGLALAEELGIAYGMQVSVALQKPLTAAALDAALAPQLVNRRHVSETDLRRALDRAQLFTHYQPKIRTTTQGWKVTGIEALLRWDHPEYGLIYPADFIGLAEQHGLITALTDFVLQTGIEQIGAWNRVGLKLDFSVNLSPLLFTDAEFPDRMSEFLRTHDVAPDQLTLEFTETAAIDNPTSTLDIMSRLRLKGIGLSLDDFGTGYSSLTQLYKLPFSEVKIDRSIGVALPHTVAAQTIMRAIIELGHNLGLEVCCEGVESQAALDFLHRGGCDYAQGYFIARPMAAAELSQWLDSENSTAQRVLRRAS